jgi:transcriptional regulator with XRE-family HTH domain
MQLVDLLKDYMKQNKLASRDIAEKAKVSHTTILHFLKGQKIDMDTFIKLCEALNINPATALGAEEDKIPKTLALIIERNPRLGTMFTSLVEQWEDGKLTTEDVEDILNYAIYRLGGTKRV